MMRVGLILLVFLATIRSQTSTCDLSQVTFDPPILKFRFAKGDPNTQGSSCFEKRSLSVVAEYDLDKLNDYLKSKCSYGDDDLLTNTLNLPTILYNVKDDGAATAFSTVNFWKELTKETVSVCALAATSDVLATSEIKLKNEYCEDFTTWPGEQFSVTAQEVNNLKGCEGETGSIQLAVNDETKYKEGYLVRTNVTEDIYSSFFLDQLPADCYAISVESATGCINIITDIVVSENDKCSNSLFRAWTKGGLPGVIVIAVTIVLIIAILAYYRLKFVPREKARKKSDEGRYRERLLRHKKAKKGFHAEAMKKYGKQAEKEKKAHVPVKQVQKEGNVKENVKENAPSHQRGISFKRIIAASPSTRVLCNMNNFDDTMFDSIPITKLTDIDPKLNVAFPGMRFAIPNPLAEFYGPGLDDLKLEKKNNDQMNDTVDFFNNTGNSINYSIPHNDVPLSAKEDTFLIPAEISGITIAVHENKIEALTLPREAKSRVNLTESTSSNSAGYEIGKNIELENNADAILDEIEISDEELETQRELEENRKVLEEMKLDNVLSANSSASDNSVDEEEIAEEEIEGDDEDDINDEDDIYVEEEVEDDEEEIEEEDEDEDEDEEREQNNSDKSYSQTESD